MSKFVRYHGLDDSMRHFAKGEGPPQTINVWEHDSGLLVSHDQPCIVCHERHAIHESVQKEFAGSLVATFQPCRQCQSLGWRLVKYTGKWWQFWKRR